MKLILQFLKSSDFYLVLSALNNWLEVTVLKPNRPNAEISLVSAFMASNNHLI